MATNFFFNNFQASQEQLLLEDLVIEAIKIYGHDIYYLPRKLNNYDDVYGSDDISSYESSYPVEMYIKSIDGFTGDGEFLSKFGVEIRNQVVFSIARRRFNEDVGEYTTQVRPNEGDIIYFPLNQRAFVIRYVNKYEMFYQLGALQTWEMTCEVFEYAGEKFSTGIPEIDIIQQNYSTNILDWSIDDDSDGGPIKTEDGDYLILEGKSASDLVIADDSDEIQRESDLFVDFSSADPFSEGTI
jgi:hypothetical protein